MTVNEWNDRWRQVFNGSTAATDTAGDEQRRRAMRHEARLVMLEQMVLGVIGATAVAYSARMPDPLPNLQEMAARPGERCHFALPGMYGGFSLELFDPADAEPYVLANCASRVVGGSQLLRRITAKSVEVVSEGEY